MLLALLLPGCIASTLPERYGVVLSDGAFRFHDDAAARAFQHDHGDSLCVIPQADGNYAWRASLDPQLPTALLPAYLSWYRRQHPQDLRWGLADCPTLTGLSPTQLAEYGERWGSQRFIFYDLASAGAFWGHLHEAGLACMEDNQPVTLVSPDGDLQLALDALAYWQRAGVIELTGVCPVGDLP